MLAVVLESSTRSDPHLGGGDNELGGWLSVECCGEEGEVEND